MRKLATAVAVSLALASGSVRALGLGEIEMQSALNQPLNAEIGLTSVRPGELEGMIVQLASSNAFTRAGIDRSEVLKSLRFVVDETGRTPVIRISTRAPIVEPFLNFLLEVDWPEGRMVREYTVLLDPPVFMTPSATERNTAADQPAVVQRGDDALVAPTPIQRETAEAPEVLLSDTGEAVALDDLGVAESAPRPVNEAQGEAVALTDLEQPNTEATGLPDVELLGDSAEVDDNAVVDEVVTVEEGDIIEIDDDGNAVLDGEIVSLDSLDTSNVNSTITVRRGDTLFEIAEDNLATGVSVQQMMIALLNANDGAFINNNINLVRSGAVLRVPGAAEAQALSQAQALAEISRQNNLWQEYRDNVRQAQATRLAQAPEAPAAPEPDTDAGAGEEEVELLSDDARAILQSAREEVSSREELRIVADSDTDALDASATTDIDADDDAARLSDINRKLQLVREDLASARLETGDLDEQAAELQNTGENLDALVNLRQTEIANLEDRLADARAAEEAAAAAEIAAAAEAEAAAEAAAQAEIDAAEAEALAAAEAAEEAQAQAQAELDAAADEADTDAVSEIEEQIDTGVETLESEAAGVAEEVTATAQNAADTVSESVQSALDESGQALGDVDLIEDTVATADNTAAADNNVAATADTSVTQPAARAWYQDLLTDKTKMGIAGVGALGLVGVVGTLLFRRRRRDDDELLDFGDEVEFLDENGAEVAAPGQAATAGADPLTDNVSGMAGAAVAAGAAGVAAASAADRSAADESPAVGAAGDIANADDTLSEVDVYLAYGLHGQAQELLTGALAREPNNPDYTQKLASSYHAQGNSEAFNALATDFESKFGQSHELWPMMVAMGHELDPNNALYAGAVETVQTMGGMGVGAAFDNDDFLGDGVEPETSSVSRDFTSADETVDFDSGDESHLMDQSLDPAFAFDESDLEATGDFSQIANELNDESDTALDFPAVGDAAADVTDDLADDIAGAVGDVADAESAVDADVDTLDAASEILEFDMGMDDQPVNDAFSNELDAGLAESATDEAPLGDDLLEFDTNREEPLDLGTVADELTLDLEQLSGDMEIDSTELLDDTLGADELEIPDLTSDDELLTGEGSGIDNTDEMDTMMDLAKAYIDMGDKDSASSALGEIVKSGTPEQVSEAETLLRKIS